MMLIARWYSPDAEPGAPAAPAAPVAEPTTDAKPGIAETIAAAREKIAAGGSLLDAPAGTPPPAEGDQARDDKGRFIPKTAAEAAGQTAGQPEPELEPEPDGGEPEEGPESAEGAGEGTEEGVEGDEDLVVEVPGRREEDDPVAIKVETPEEAERLRQLVNGYQRSTEIRKQQEMLRADRQALANIEARLELDPEGFLFDNIPRERAASVALQVLLDDQVWSPDVAEFLTELATDDRARNAARMQLENDRLKNQQKVQSQLQVRQQVQANVESVKQTCAMLVPESLPEDQQVALYQAMQEEVAAYADRNNLTLINPRDIPAVVAMRLQEAGVDPVAAATALFRTAGGPSGREKPAPRTTRPAGKKPTGAEFVKARDRTRAASTTAPAGTAAPSAAAPPKPSRKDSIEERLEWGRKNLRFG